MVSFAKSVPRIGNFMGQDHVVSLLRESVDLRVPVGRHLNGVGVRRHAVHVVRAREVARPHDEIEILVLADCLHQQCARPPQKLLPECLER